MKTFTEEGNSKMTIMMKLLPNDKKLLVEYESLPHLERQILRILSIAYIKLNQTQLLTCLAALDIQTEDGQKFNLNKKNDMFKLLRPSLDNLLNHNFMVGKSRSILAADPHYARVIIQQLLAENSFTAMAESIRNALDLTEEGFDRERRLSMDRLKAVMRMLFFSNTVTAATELYDRYIKKISDSGSKMDVWREICCEPFDPDLFILLPPDIHTQYLSTPYIRGLMKWESNTPQDNYAEKLVAIGSDRCEEELMAAVLTKWMLTGRQQELDAWLQEHGPKYPENSLCLQGWMAFCKDAGVEAIQLYEKALELLNQRGKSRRKKYFNHFMGIFYILALIKEGKPETLAQAKQCIPGALKKSGHLDDVYENINHLIDFLTGNSRGADSILEHTFWDDDWRLEDELTTPFFQLWAYYWVDHNEAAQALSKIRSLKNIAQKKGFIWFQHELEGMIALLSPKAANHGAKHIVQPKACLATITRATNVWEHTLNALLRLHEKAPVDRQKEVDELQDVRLAWQLDYEQNGECHVSPREQKKSAAGAWTRGRPIALKRLCTEIETFSYFSAQDKKICSHIYPHHYKSGWYTNVEYVFDDEYMPDVVGHPFLFAADGVTRLELVEGRPEFSVAKKGKDMLHLTLSPQPRRHFKAKYVVVRDTPTRLKLITLDKRYQDMADILGQGITVPTAAADKVRQVMEKIGSVMTINSAIEGGGGQDLALIEADARIHALLAPLGSGLKLSLAVRPFGEHGPSYSPGEGGKNVIALVQGRQVQTIRDLRQEKALAAELMNACPTLQAAEETLGEWCFPEIQEALGLLLELEALKERIILEWPEGQPLRLAGRVSFSRFRARIQQQEDWFAISGAVAVDEQLTLDLMTLLEKGQTRFMALDDGRFVELTREFQERLRQLRRYTLKRDGKIGFHPLAALALEGLVDDIADLKADKAWNQHIAKLRRVPATLPAVPSTLAADLRDYQVEGFRWMARLSDWGVGACLADDMGLGKTLQALAMLIQHAPGGPSLVIAPTSVCANWIMEAARFAPTLNMMPLGPGVSQQDIARLGRFDVVVCSYGRMQQKKTIEMLTSVAWRMAILDEAQAIKNLTTQRSRAAMQLNAAFKLILTGTPIENHLGELWNLFQFITPGLLGSLEWFNQTFSLPIEKQGVRQARQDLKKLIQPFILRRTKGQVLEELPARTEIQLDVDLSVKETAFYEALRRQALERLEQDKESHPGKRHVKILAEITRLRQACCHSSLIDQDIVIPSSKLAVFREILDDLLANRHKALVFSQFLGHLAIVRNHLDNAGIAYQYLDGATPAAQRQKAIDAFQSGQGDIFLISLKAGGQGLNLTAADYVIHLDPWWNPAVENQASDRAHRIGQQRPVTIYRLVARNTVEEKIVRMHSRKRDLADSLLQGGDVSAKMSAEELLELIRGGH